MKTCSKCTQIKPKSEFYVNKNKAPKQSNEEDPYYIFPYCKQCDTKFNRKRSQTKSGLAKALYHSQTLHAKRRNHSCPDYTKEELFIWLQQQPQFEAIYLTWKQANFPKNLRPSCDRLDDYKPYTLSNLRLVTWEENWAKGNTDQLSGINRKTNRAVLQNNINGEQLNTYYSIQEASRQTQIPHGNIIKCCQQSRKTAGGYQWEYVHGS